MHILLSTLGLIPFFFDGFCGMSLGNSLLFWFLFVHESCLNCSQHPLSLFRKCFRVGGHERLYDFGQDILILS